MQKQEIAYNIILVQEEINYNIDNKEKGVIIKMDMENAFDKVWHSLLFNFLWKFGFRESVVLWDNACIDFP